MSFFLLTLDITVLKELLDCCVSMIFLYIYISVTMTTTGDNILDSALSKVTIINLKRS